MSLREIKEKARGQLHQAMKVSAFYFAHGSLDPVRVDVRVHTKFDAKIGDLAGTNFNYAETKEHIPQLVFWRAELEPKNRGTVWVSADEVYQIDNVSPPDGLTRKAAVSLVLNAERQKFTDAVAALVP